MESSVAPGRDHIPQRSSAGSLLRVAPAGEDASDITSGRQTKNGGRREGRRPRDPGPRRLNQRFVAAAEGVLPSAAESVGPGPVQITVSSANALGKLAQRKRVCTSERRASDRSRQRRPLRRYDTTDDHSHPRLPARGGTPARRGPHDDLADVHSRRPRPSAHRQTGPRHHSLHQHLRVITRVAIPAVTSRSWFGFPVSAAMQKCPLAVT